MVTIFATITNTISIYKLNNKNVVDYATNFRSSNKYTDKF